MRTTAKQRRAMLDAQWCEQYRKTNWDGCAANDYFARYVHRDPGSGFLNKPSHVTFERLREMEIAINQVYFNVAPLAFQKEKIMDYLGHVVQNTVFVPPSIVHVDAYTTAYLEKVNEILENIQKQRYDFQK